MASTREKWDAIYACADGKPPEPIEALRDYAYLLPTSGTALDLACGRGGNALFLAQHGLHTSAWDISSVAIERLRERSDESGLQIDAQVCDVVDQPPPANAFDVIVVTRFLERQLADSLVNALKPLGLLIYQTFVVEKTDRSGPSNPDFLLAPNELLALFQQLRVRVFLDLGNCGDANSGLRNESLLIAQSMRRR